MMSIFLILIAGLGLVLIGTLSFQVSQQQAAIKLKAYQNQQAGLADLLNFAAVVDDGVIVGKNGALMAAWLYAGQDKQRMSSESLELVSFRINQTLSRLGSGWMLHVDAVRHEVPHYSAPEQSFFPDDISRMVDEERRTFFESLDTLYDGYFVLTLSWLPPSSTERALVNLMFDDETKTLDEAGETQSLLAQFNQECSRIESGLSSVLSLNRLNAGRVERASGQPTTHDNFLRFLHYCVTGLNHPIVLPRNPMVIDALIGGQELWGGVIPKIGRHYIQCVAIEGFPLESHPGILSVLSELACTYRWSTRFIFMDQHEALAHLERYRKKWKQKIRGFFDQVFNTGSSAVDADALAMVVDSEEALAEISSGMVAQGYYTGVVVLMHEDRSILEAQSRFFEKKINELGFAARTETVNTMEAFLGSIPGHGVQNVRRPLLNTMNLADLLPTSQIWSGVNGAPSPLFPDNAPPLMHCMTCGDTPFRLNLHVRDLGHTLIFGPTRSGKSTLLALIALQFLRYPKARVVAFDKGLSMMPACKASGGCHYNLGASGEALAFAPLQDLSTTEARAWALGWIETILTLNDVAITPTQRNEIGLALDNMRASGSGTLSELSVLIQDEPIREALKQYTLDGAMGYLLDAQQDGLQSSHFMTFELETLMGMGEKFALPVLLYLFWRIESALDGRPTLLSLDEAWLMLQHPVFKSKIANWLDSMAKKNCCVVLSTQHISHAANSGIMDTLIASTATKIFLPNVHVHDDEMAPLYRRMGLNTRQMDIIQTAVPKQDYYYVSTEGQRLFQLALGRMALAFVGSGDMDSLAAIQALERTYGSAWVKVWLEQKGLVEQQKEAA